MAVFLCPHCDDLIELLGDERRPAPQCDCGGLMEPIEVQEERDRLNSYRASSISFEARGG